MFKTYISLFSLFIIVTLTACSSGTIVKTYEGEKLQKEQVAILNAPEYISLISVNGRNVPKYLLSSIDVNYGLKPGLNVVVFEYESVWAVARAGKEKQRSDLVASGKKEVVFNAEVGKHYTFQFEQTDNIREARALAENFTANVVTQAGEVVASSAELGTYQPVVEQVAVTSVQPTEALTQPATPVAGATLAAAAPAVVSQAPMANSALPPIEGMKVLWNSATAEEKKAFLKWAFQ